MKLKETKRQFVVKSGDVWEWAESNETLRQIQNYWDLVKSNGNITEK